MRSFVVFCLLPAELRAELKQSGAAAQLFVAFENGGLLPIFAPIVERIRRALAAGLGP